MSAIPYMSNRFAMKRFLGMSAEEIAENERMWREENDLDKGDAGFGMKDIGSVPTEDDFNQNDFDDIDDLDDTTEDGSVIDGSENAETDTEA